VTSLKTTPLHAAHQRLGARLIDFAGFEMPVQYNSILEEHKAVRERVGIFDVSHMGQIFLSGPRAVEAAEHLLTCKVASLRVGRVRYGLLCNESGGVVDDVTVYRIAEDRVLLCVNASNIEKDHAWALEHAGDGVSVDNRSDEMGMLALQGPNATALLTQLAGPEPGELKRFRFGEFRIGAANALISSTGYTGAPGFELYLEADDTLEVFEAILGAGEEHGLLPVGLGARDTLRLEAALPLYGHELDDTTSPLEAGLDRFVKRDQGGFIGAEAIERRAASGTGRALVGFELLERGIARADHAISHHGREVGIVTSGAPSVSLGKSIGLGYVPSGLAPVGTRLAIAIRKKLVNAEVIETPFV
jgi:aminomethyltransferase